MMISKQQQQRLSFILWSIASSVIVAQIQITPDVDEGFGVDPIIEQPIVDPEFGVDPPVDPEFGVDPVERPVVDEGFVVDPMEQPAIDPGFGVDVPNSCSADTDCNSDNTEYCGQGICVPHGQCLSDSDCFNPSNNVLPLLDTTTCVGYVYCNASSQECQRECSGFDCPGNVPQTECRVTGCDQGIPCPGALYCVPDFCAADCPGRYFDSSGTVLTECNPITADPGFGVDPNEQPVLDEDFGQDPMEERPTVDEDFGQDDPIEPPLLLDPEFGVDPEFQDEVGTPESPVPDASGQCRSQSECTTVDEYCSNGYCLPQGSCLTKYDCFSPHNSLSTATLGVKCVGHLDCNVESGSSMGVCQIDCTGVENSCPNNNEIATDFDKNPVSLPDGTTGTPCEIRNCPGYNSDWCYNEACGEDGGGTAVFITTAGTPDDVCTPCVGASSCDDNKKEFCAGGVCIPYGQCNSSTDCLNPANTLVSATTCIGFLDCFVGNCQQVCKESGCPNDLQQVPYTTATDPCANMSRICPQAVSCVVDDCGVLAALFYDMDGNMVCPQGTTSYDGYYLRK